MYRESIVLGVAPTKRGILSMEEASRQKDRFMKVVREAMPDLVQIVDLDDICENGILYTMDDVPAAIEKFHTARVDALFIPFCDFGEEQCAAAIAAAFKVPVLVWGARDEVPNVDGARGRDTQCGMFAATKVLRRCGVKYSYIINCETESATFRTGLDRFLRVAAILKSVRSLRIAVVGQRPGPFMSVMTNEGNLLTRFGIQTIPVSASSVAQRATEMIAKGDSEFEEYYQDLKSRMDCSTMPEEGVRTAAALKISLQRFITENNCSAAAVECWSAFRALVGIPPCLALGELSDLGLPASCETDLNGAVTMAILRACALYEQAVFLADLTIRNPENDNSELLWHCGPFPYSLKSESCPARLVEARERFELRQGHLTLARFDDIDGEYTLFAGEGGTTTGPETTGTYVYLEVDDWKRWEEKLMFGPYIHHIGCVYGSHLPVLREVARYLDITFDDASVQGIHSL